MVMPCSRSARRPSVSSEKSIGAGRPVHRRFRHGLELIFVDALRIVQQAADQRGFAVVHAAGGGEAQQILGLLLRQEVFNLEGGGIDRRERPSEISLALLDFHGAFLIVIDHAILTFGSAERD